MDESFLGPCLTDCRDVVHWMAERDRLYRRDGRLDARQRLKFFRFECTLDGAQPVGPFRVAERGEMLETGGGCDEKSGHLANLGNGRLRRNHVGFFRPCLGALYGNASAASASITPAAPSTTVRSSAAAPTAIFSAKNRVVASRALASSPSRSAASACFANRQPPVAYPNNRK